VDAHAPPATNLVTSDLRAARLRYASDASDAKVQPCRRKPDIAVVSERG
jgi:hypothetical protein